MQSEALTTITARYSLREDRIIVDGVIHTGDELQLAFTRRLGRAVHLDCAEAVLRNLIDIFYKLFVAAEWDLGVFPAWAAGQAGLDQQSHVMN